MNQIEWFLQKFRDWEEKSGHRQTATAFADFLEVKPPTLNRWMNGHAVPEGESLRKIAKKLGPEIYILLGQGIPPDLVPTDGDLAPIAEMLFQIPLYKRPAARKAIAEMLGKMIKEESEKYG